MTILLEGKIKMNNYARYAKLFWAFVWYVIPATVLAEKLPQVPPIGEVAGQLLEPAGVLSDFVGTAAWIIGFTCVFAAFFRYMQYRVNPVATPLSSVLFLLVIGIVLISLPFAYLLTGEGVPFPHGKKP